MTADDLVQELGAKIYELPLSNVRIEACYPDLTNPLHLVVLLLDCDIEIVMNGMLGFLENSTGQFLEQTIKALQIIGASESADILGSLSSCMSKHGVTWKRLRDDFEGSKEYQVTSFRELHGDMLKEFAREVVRISQKFALFRTPDSGEDVYGAMCEYLEGFRSELPREIDIRM